MIPPVRRSDKKGHLQHHILLIFQKLISPVEGLMSNKGVRTAKQIKAEHAIDAALLVRL